MVTDAQVTRYMDGKVPTDVIRVTNLTYSQRWYVYAIVRGMRALNRKVRRG